MVDKQHMEDLRHIRGVMDRSTRFLSLSGLSGVWAGVVALAGALAAQQHHQLLYEATRRMDPLDDHAQWNNGGTWSEHITFLLGDATLVLILAVAGAWWFTWRRGRKTGEGIWDPSARRLLLNLFLPLAAGGAFCLALLYHGDVMLVAPATLVFYGLALINASKYTLNEIRWLGIGQMLLGILSAFWLGSGLMFWALGFGVLHILYGSLMYIRHERSPHAGQ